MYWKWKYRYWAISIFARICEIIEVVVPIQYCTNIGSIPGLGRKLSCHIKNLEIVNILKTSNILKILVVGCIIPIDIENPGIYEYFAECSKYWNCSPGQCLVQVIEILDDCFQYSQYIWKNVNNFNISLIIELFTISKYWSSNVAQDSVSQYLNAFSILKSMKIPDICVFFCKQIDRLWWPTLTLQPFLRPGSMSRLCSMQVQLDALCPYYRAWCTG